MIFRFLDRLLGLMEVYTYTHEFFRNSLIALTSNLNPPETVIGPDKAHGDPEECDTLWYNHHGGFDGIRQKGWTLITIGLLLLVEARIGIKFQKIGQADNQVCRLYLLKKDPTLSDEEYAVLYRDDIQEQVSLFWTVLNDISNKIGLKTKPEESATSSNIVIYGKNILYKGFYLHMSLKKISRCLPDVNEVYPSNTLKWLLYRHQGWEHFLQDMILLHPVILLKS